MPPLFRILQYGRCQVLGTYSVSYAAVLGEPIQHLRACVGIATMTKLLIIRRG